MISMSAAENDVVLIHSEEAAQHLQPPKCLNESGSPADLAIAKP